jgi:glycosyltransferase involved in cell wall biosynthesis
MFSLHIDTARTWRGGQNQVLLTVAGLGAAGHRAVLVAHPEGELRRRAANDMELVPLAPRVEIDLTAAWRFARLLRVLAPDVIHAHDPHGVAMAALALSFGTAREKGLRPPALVAARRVDFHLRGNAFSRWKYRQVDCFTAASEAIRQMLVADGIPTDRTVTVHEGIDVQYAAGVAAVDVHEAFGLPHHAPVVGNVAALVAHKGQRYLVDAAQLVVRQIPDARFIILGEGELRDQLERQIKQHHLEKHVLLPGFRSDVVGCMKSFDVFVMSSVTEGLGTALLDAMACSRPVVATRTGGIPEIVEDGVTGVLVPPRDHVALAAAIVRALNDPALRARLGAAGRARVAARFTVERMVEATARVYERVAGKGHAMDNSPPELRTARGPQPPPIG